MLQCNVPTSALACRRAVRDATPDDALSRLGSKGNSATTASPQRSHIGSPYNSNAGPDLVPGHLLPFMPQVWPDLCVAVSRLPSLNVPG